MRLAVGRPCGIFLVKLVVRQRLRFAADVHQPELVQGFEDYALSVRRERRAHDAFHGVRRLSIRDRNVCADKRGRFRVNCASNGISCVSPDSQRRHVDLAVAGIEQSVAGQPCGGKGKHVVDRATAALPSTIRRLLVPANWIQATAFHPATMKANSSARRRAR